MPERPRPQAGSNGDEPGVTSAASFLLLHHQDCGGKPPLRPGLALTLGKTEAGTLTAGFLLRPTASSSHWRVQIPPSRDPPHPPNNNSHLHCCDFCPSSRGSHTQGGASRHPWEPREKLGNSPDHTCRRSPGGAPRSAVTSVRRRGAAHVRRNPIQEGTPPFLCLKTSPLDLSLPLRPRYSAFRLNRGLSFSVWLTLVFNIWQCCLAAIANGGA